MILARLVTSTAVPAWRASVMTPASSATSGGTAPSVLPTGHLLATEVDQQPLEGWATPVGREDLAAPADRLVLLSGRVPACVRPLGLAGVAVLDRRGLARVAFGDGLAQVARQVERLLVRVA